MMKSSNGPAGAVAILAVLALLAGSFLLGQGGTDAFAGMGKRCSNCHSGGTSGSVEVQDSTGAPRTAFSVAPSGTVTMVLLGEELPDAGAFVALEMDASFSIIQSFTGAENSPDPGTLIVVNGDRNDLEPGAAAVKASIALTIKSGAPVGVYEATAILGYGGPAGIARPEPVTFTVVAPPEDTPPVFVSVGYPVSVPLDTPIRVSASITDDNGVTSARLLYRVAGKTGSGAFETLNLSLSSGTGRNGTWEAEIPGQPFPGAVHFILNASDGRFFVQSPHGQADAEYQVLVLEPGSPGISHQPVTTGFIGAGIAIDAVVTEAGTGVRLVYTGAGVAAPATLTMTLTGGTAMNGTYSAVLPAQDRKGTVTYRINATNGTRGTETPDYRIEIISLWEPEIAHVPVSSAYAGRETPLNATARNAAALTLWFKGVGEASYRSMAMVRAGSGADGSWQFTGALPAQGGPGTLSYYINATNGTLFAETGVHQVKVAEALDLVLLEVSFSEREPAVYGEVTIRAKVRNNSTRDLHGIQVSFHDDFYPPGDARYIGLVSDLTIPAGSTITVRAFWLPQVNGTHQIRVRVDSTGAVKEVDEGNNELTMKVPVRHEVHRGFTFAPFWGALPGVLLPVFAVAAGFLVGVAGHLLMRKQRNG